MAPSLLRLGLILLLASAFAPPLPAQLGEPGCNGEVLALLNFRGDLIAGGMFSQAGGVAAGRIARWDGESWHALGAGVDGQWLYTDNEGTIIPIPAQVMALAEYQGDLIVGGSFIHAGPVVSASIARWDGSQWHPLGTAISAIAAIDLPNGTSYYFPPQVSALAVQDDYLIVGGTFTEAGGVSANYIARWDGWAWSAMGQGMDGGLPPRVAALTVHQGSLIAGGNFENVQISLAERIARWDGNTWTPFRLRGFDGIVNALIPYGGMLVAAGNFEMAGFQPVLHVARWQGSNWLPMADGIPNEVHALTLFNGGLYAGAFRWESTAWVNRLHSNGPVRALCTYKDRLIVGGSFSQLDGHTRQNIAAWPEDFTAVPPAPEIPPPNPLYLAQNRPNPFNPGTALRFDLARDDRVSLAIFDAQGRRLVQLWDALTSAGEHEVRWDGRDAAGRSLPSGVYFARLQGADASCTRKITLAR